MAEKILIDLETRGFRKVSGDFNQLAQSSRRVHLNMGRVGKTTESLTAKFNRAGFNAFLLTANFRSLATVLGAGAFAKATNDFVNLQNRIRLVTTDSAQLLAVQGELFKQSQEIQVGFKDTVDVYSRLARSTKDTGVSQKELIGITRTLNQFIQISGANAKEASSGLIQFSQGLASAELKGDELRSVLENTPALAIALAKELSKDQGLRDLFEVSTLNEGFEISIGLLRELGAEGQLTRERLVPALIRLADEAEEAFKDVNFSASANFQRVRNSFLLFIGNLNEQAGTLDIFSDLTKGASDFIDTMTEGLPSALLKINQFGQQTRDLVPTFQQLKDLGKFLFSGALRQFQLFRSALSTSSGPIAQSLTTIFNDPVKFFGEALQFLPINIKAFVEILVVEFLDFLFTVTTKAREKFNEFKRFSQETANAVIGFFTGSAFAKVNVVEQLNARAELPLRLQLRLAKDDAEELGDTLAGLQNRLALPETQKKIRLGIQDPEIVSLLTQELKLKQDIRLVENRIAELRRTSASEADPRVAIIDARNAAITELQRQIAAREEARAALEARIAQARGELDEAGSVNPGLVDTLPGAGEAGALGELELARAQDILRRFGLEVTAVLSDTDKLALSLADSLRTPRQILEDTVNELVRNKDVLGETLFTGGLNKAQQDYQAAIDKLKDKTSELGNFAELVSENLFNTFADTLASGFEGGFQGLRATFSKLLIDLGAQLLTSQLFKALGSLFNQGAAGSTGGLSTVLGAFGAAFGGTAAGKAIGGPVQANRPFMVGERGPELFVPQQSGVIDPLRGGGGQQQESNTFVIVEQDPDAIVNALDTARGRKIIRKVISSDSASFQAALGVS